MLKSIKCDIKAVLYRDPAARNALEVILLYSGFHALLAYRIAHFFHKHKFYFIARFISQLARFFTGIEIHPGAKIGSGVFIDHGMGVVIGETAEVGDNCTIYQGVTLGGTGKDTGKRHPTIGNNVLIGAGAKVLGPFKVGDNSKIAANAVVLNEVPPNSTCVGVPARIVKIGDRRISSARDVEKDIDLDQIHIPDPISQEFCRMQQTIAELKEEIEKLKASR